MSRASGHHVAGIDVGSTYTKAAVLDPGGAVTGRAMAESGYRLEAAAREALERACEESGVATEDVGYVLTTGYGRHRVDFRNLQATSLTAQAWGVRHFFPATRTVLDVGGQTMKAMRLDDAGRVQAFRLNDKCAAGTGAFLEKAAGYLGYELREIGPLVQESRAAVPISGVCAVFAESEVINHVTQGEDPADIMHGAMASLTEKSVRLMKRVRMEPEFTLVGGIMRFPTMVELMRRELPGEINVPAGELAQFTGAVGAAVLARRMLRERRGESPEIAPAAAGAEGP